MLLATHFFHRQELFNEGKKKNTYLEWRKPIRMQVLANYYSQVMERQDRLTRRRFSHA